MRLKGKVAIVTGAAQGIGRAIAKGIRNEGAVVVVADLQGNKAQELAEQLTATEAEAYGLEVDVSEETSVQRLARETLGRYGRVDILVNNAGIYPIAPVTEMTEKEWDRVLETNLGGNFLCSRAFVPTMRAQKSGRIISIASAIAFYGARGGAHYAASKAGIIGFVKALAREVARDRITVNAICPGITDTELPRGHRTEKELQERFQRNPLGRTMKPEDLVGPVLFLVSDAASYITGQSLSVNCGTYMS